MKQLERDTSPRLRTRITVRTKLASIAEIAEKDKRKILTQLLCELVHMGSRMP